MRIISSITLIIHFLSDLYPADLRDPTTTPLNFTKSINLALSERGINAMRNSKSPSLLEKVISETIPMKGRMVHRRSASGELYEQSQDYDAHGRVSYPSGSIETFQADH
jgi:kynurenine 3-monooxygenase